MRALTLTRYFSFLSLILVVIAGTVLGFLVFQQDIHQMTESAQDRNVNLTKLLHTLLADEINPFIAQPGPQRATALQAKIALVTADSNIFKLKLYNPQGITIFSTDPTQVGEDESANAGFISATTGVVASELTQRDQLSKFDGGSHKIDLVSSYVPVKQDGQLVAIFEVYQDVTQLVKLIHASMLKIATIVVSVLGLLYFLLLLVVRRAQKLLTESQTQLENSNRELDQRVTDRTDALQQSESRFRILTDMASDYCWETDEFHRFTMHTVNKRKSTESSKEAGYLIGKFWWDIPHVSPDEATWSAHRALVDSHQIFHEFEVSRVDRNGNLRHFSISGQPKWDAAGRFTGYLGVGYDITLRKQADADLRLAAATFESKEATIVTDVNSVILRVNQAFTSITGYEAHEVVGRTPRVMASGRHDVHFYQSMWECIRRTGGWQGEIWDRRKDGEIYPKWLTITAVKGKDDAISHYIGTHSDITERKKNEEKIQQLAFFDSLTSLPNRTLLLDRLRQAMAVSNRNQTFGALLFIDLDHFKALNDTQGHDKGDLLLQQVARRLSACVREGDTVARLGGDEFVVVLKNLGDNAQDVAAVTKDIGEKILAELNQNYQLDGLHHHNSASIGATVFGGHEIAIEDLLKQADLAMYQSKDKGRNLLRFFDPAMQKIVLERAALEAGLRLALTDNQLVLYYQAQVDGNGHTAGAEALVRWQHPQRGIVSPAEFIPLAEETGLILPLGLWVLESACTQLAQWTDQAALSHLCVAVNVSARQFKQSDFVSQVLSVLERTGARADRLKLELTESLLVDNVEDVIAKMVALKSVGVGFSLDDFGTGYSSLAYLSRLPLDQLKIDKGFVMNIESSDNAVAICAATIGLAHNLRLKVVAEGVETDAQRYVLHTVHRCDLLQGYLYSRPLPVDAFMAYAASHVAPGKQSAH